MTNRDECITSDWLIYYTKWEELEYVSYHHEMLSAMETSEIIQYIQPYKKRINILKRRRLDWWEITKHNMLEQAERVVRQLEYELQSRNQKGSSKVDIRKKLAETPIALVIQALWVDISKYNKRYNMKCPLPNHKDSTPSFRIYEHKNDWYCFWCKCWGNAIDFIREYKWVENRVAVKDFINNF